ncbi:hypothetical protein SELSPUOL_02333 [Selenomonas sputigena ATCC 35185]|uniref:Uncharacterized protein n=1 Tax=Selenomonas sputigena (strain ATCC 35185 / DSM 20758 / CCUG 44933 / VPI D19B-28) TaxID=546271 RepID=C9LXX4_SELS3|nr:hypothetical protein SELSPUOL_02333 [Selenomonas sputigena ATCC 35185]
MKKKALQESLYVSCLFIVETREKVLRRNFNQLLFIIKIYCLRYAHKTFVII